MPRAIYLYLSICLLIAVWGCKDKYVSAYKSPPTGYLVVEGYISGNTPTQFTLSRTILLPGDSAIPGELGARVQVEGSDNSTYPLTELGGGVYSSVDTLALTATTQYRLRIHTGNGEDYLSDLVTYKVTPPIDSINWINSSSGVSIYANTHDPSNNTRYYQWDYIQTYEYHSAEESYYYYDVATGTVLPRPDSLESYTCWTTTTSQNILVNSSDKLAQDVIYRQPLTQIPPNSIQISALYSLLVRQYALTEDGYNFLSLMQKNSETLGSVFDDQPSQLTGNIHCLTYAAERVIGYVSAGTVQQQRIYINRNQVPSNYAFFCLAVDSALPTDGQSLMSNFGYNVYTPLNPQYQGGSITGWYSNHPSCVMCEALGGVNIKPSFWPN
jgi:Domain of unknown function (DUF4249)